MCHADIKPENVLINNSGEAALSDFGLSRVLLGLNMHSGLTTGTGVRGTPGYMAPELFDDDNTDGPTCKSDVYAFGGLILAVSIVATGSYTKGLTGNSGDERKGTICGQLTICNYVLCHDRKTASSSLTSTSSS